MGLYLYDRMSEAPKYLKIPWPCACVYTTSGQSRVIIQRQTYPWLHRGRGCFCRGSARVYAFFRQRNHNFCRGIICLQFDPSLSAPLLALVPHSLLVCLDVVLLRTNHTAWTSYTQPISTDTIDYLTTQRLCKQLKTRRK